MPVHRMEPESCGNTASVGLGILNKRNVLRGMGSNGCYDAWRI